MYALFVSACAVDQWRSVAIKTLALRAVYRCNLISILRCVVEYSYFSWCVCCLLACTGSRGNVLCCRAPGFAMLPPIFPELLLRWSVSDEVANEVSKKTPGQFSQEGAKEWAAMAKCAKQVVQMRCCCKRLLEEFSIVRTFAEAIPIRWCTNPIFRQQCEERRREKWVRSLTTEFMLAWLDERDVVVSKKNTQIGTLRTIPFLSWLVPQLACSFRKQNACSHLSEIVTTAVGMAVCGSMAVSRYSSAAAFLLRVQMS